MNDVNKIYCRKSNEVKNLKLTSVTIHVVLFSNTVEPAKKYNRKQVHPPQ